MESINITLEKPGLSPLPALTKVLVAEDDRISQVFMRNLMDHYGVQVQVASNGRETLKIWQDWQPDLILMDMRMPEFTGLEVTKTIRHRIAVAAKTANPLPYPVIIAITASAFPEDQELLMAAGCNDCLAKPISLEDLNLALSTYFDLEEAVKGLKR